MIIHFDVIIIGGGPAGIVAANNIARQGYKVLILEKELNIGSHIKNIKNLFPNFMKADNVLYELTKKTDHKNICLETEAFVEKTYKENNIWFVRTSEGKLYSSHALILATGFRIFDARYKEELGYGLYKGVINTVELEAMIMKKDIKTAQGKLPQKIAFVNCVGSRDEKVGNHYCSRVCCINAVKQSIEIKELIPDAEIYCFYMDIRMAGQFYEELYRKSQETYHVNYIRGRVSEAAETIDKRIQIKAEDTLSQLPLKMTVDLLVLMTGVEASDSTTKLSTQLKINGEYGFAKSTNLHLSDNQTIHKGLFLAGCCKRPLTLPETIADARAAALCVVDYLKNN